MIIGNNLIFIHLDKCAGVYLTKFFMDYFEAKRIGGRHTNPKEHNEEIQNFRKKNENPLIIGSIRSPYAFYVSLFSYGCEHKNSNYRTLKAYDNKFIEIYSDAYNIENFQYWLKQIMSEPIYLMGESLNGKVGNKLITREKAKENLKAILEEDLKEDNCGLLTKLFFRRFQECNYQLLIDNDYKTDIWVTDYIKVENLIENLQLISKKILREKSREESREESNEMSNLTSFLISQKESDKINRTSHHPYQNYYNKDLSDLVWKKDNYIFKKFNYEKLEF